MNSFFGFLMNKWVLWLCVCFYLRNSGETITNRATNHDHLPMATFRTKLGSFAESSGPPLPVRGLPEEASLGHGQGIDLLPNIRGTIAATELPGTITLGTRRTKPDTPS
jgi:hypothetical protein